MPKVLFEGYRVGKNGGERWIGVVPTGQVDRDGRNGQYREVTRDAKPPKGGSAIHRPEATKK